MADDFERELWSVQESSAGGAELLSAGRKAWVRKRDGEEPRSGGTGLPLSQSTKFEVDKE